MIPYLRTPQTPSTPVRRTALSQTSLHTCGATAPLSAGRLSALGNRRLRLSSSRTPFGPAYSVCVCSALSALNRGAIDRIATLESLESSLDMRDPLLSAIYRAGMDYGLEIKMPLVNNAANSANVKTHDYCRSRALRVTAQPSDAAICSFGAD